MDITGFEGARIGKALLLALAFLTVPASAAPQQWSLTFDNDLIGLRGLGHPPDYDYTSGLRLERRSRTVQFAVGQEIYTHSPARAFNRQPRLASAFSRARGDPE